MKFSGASGNLVIFREPIHLAHELGLANKLCHKMHFSLET